MAKVKVKRRKATSMAYIEHRGSYDGIPFDDYYSKLYEWAKKNKARPGFKPFAVYMNDPHVTPEGELLTRVAIPIGKAGAPSGEVKVDSLPEMEVAILKHAAPAEEYNNSYAELTRWVEENGYRITAPPIEVYTKKPKVSGGKTIIYSDILFPIQKKQ